MSAEPDDFTAELDGEVQDGAGGDGADVNNAQAVRMPDDPACTRVGPGSPGFACSNSLCFQCFILTSASLLCLPLPSTSCSLNVASALPRLCRSSRQ